MTQPDKFDLEALLNEARASPPQMPEGLADRIAGDAHVHLPTIPLWRRLMAAVGGPAGLGGLVTATVVGLLFGVAPPGEAVDPFLLIAAGESAGIYDVADLTEFAWPESDWGGIGLDSDEG